MFFLTPHYALAAKAMMFQASLCAGTPLGAISQSCAEFYAAAAHSFETPSEPKIEPPLQIGHVNIAKGETASRIHIVEQTSLFETDTIKTTRFTALESNKTRMRRADIPQIILTPSVETISSEALQKTIKALLPHVGVTLIQWKKGESAHDDVTYKNALNAALETTTRKTHITNADTPPDEILTAVSQSKPDITLRYVA